NTSMNSTHIDNAYNDLVSSIEREFRRLKQVLAEQEIKEKEEGLKKIQMELERERKKKLAEEKRLEQEKEEFRQRSAIVQRQKEEEQFKGKLTAEETKRQKERLAKESDEEARLAEMNERERRDYDLARRLALETGGEADLPHLQRTRRPNANQKHDLSNHTYAQLRDLINTSCDVELLEACREEFHRRLKVYHAWRSKNRKGKNPSALDDQMDEDEERAPKDILNNMVPPSMTGGPLKSTESLKKPRQLTTNVSLKTISAGKGAEQRYFRIPFIRPHDQNRDTHDDQKKKGWWYAHFDDKWIARQMEIHPNKEAVLLVAGVDDMNMCELSLDETGLTSKKGAEILESDFEQEWLKHGGREYLNSHFGQISSKYVVQLLQNYR
ncbi:unnamed protein product, partial [Rotaria sp. Silwood2]